MTAALQFLWSILLSVGLSVSADNVGDTFSTIYANQDPVVQQRMDLIMRDPVIAAQMGALELTSDAYIYINGLDPENPVISNDIIQESIGIDNWKLLVEQNKNNVGSNVLNNSFACGDYTFEYGADKAYYVDDFGKSRLLVFGYCDLYYKGDLINRFTNGGCNVYAGGSSETNALVTYDGIATYIYFDESTKSVVIPAVSGIPNMSNQYVIDLSSYIVDDVIPVSESAPIGTAGDYTISSDGTIILPDGTVITQNADGTYTIGGNVYSPLYNLNSYTDPALSSLLSQILQRISDLESALEFENELDNSQAEALEGVKSYTGTMQEFLYTSPRWTTVFPFCIPWDFVRGVKLLSVEPVAPVLSIPFEIPSFGPFNGYKTYITLDFSEYEKYFVPVRWFSTMFFLMSLGFLTFKIVKGAA